MAHTEVRPPVSPSFSSRSNSTVNAFSPIDDIVRWSERAVDRNRSQSSVVRHNVTRSFDRRRGFGWDPRVVLQASPRDLEGKVSKYVDGN